MFWKTTKPFFSDKGLGKSNITLTEGDDIYQEDAEVAKVRVIIHSFSAVSVTDIEKEIKALDSKKASMSSSIPSNVFHLVSYSIVKSMKLCSEFK